MNTNKNNFPKDANELYKLAITYGKKGEKALKGFSTVQKSIVSMAWTDISLQTQ